MKKIEFEDIQNINLEEIGKQLFECYESDDPRSNFYKRDLNRPNIRWGKIATKTILPCLSFILGFIILRKIGYKNINSFAVIFTILVLYIIKNSRKAMICLIMIYQRYAPDSIRNKCRFEPSCSQYMILSIQKCGAIKGLKRGINRLKRCNVNDGGIDLP